MADSIPTTLIEDSKLLFLMTIIVLASLPVVAVVALSRLGTIDSNRASPFLLFSIFIVWAVALYLLFSTSPHGKMTALLVAGPGFLTYMLFFKNKS